MTKDTRKSIITKCGLSVTNDLGQYLGIPIIHKFVNRSTCSYVAPKLQDKIANKLASLQAQCLSMASKDILAKLVMEVILIYTM